MEVIVSACVGALTAISLAALSTPGLSGELTIARRRLALILKGVERALLHAREEIEGKFAAYGVLTPRKRVERNRVERAMPEAFGSLAVSLSSGLSLSQAMQYVGSRAEEPVRTEFLHASALMTCGVSSVDALDELVERLDAPALDLVVLALKVSRRTGAALGGLLSEAAGLVGERIALMRQLEVKTAQVRMSARLVAGMPVFMVGFLSLASSDFRAGVFTPSGLGSLAVALFLNMFAWSIIRKIMRVDV